MRAEVQPRLNGYWGTKQTSHLRDATYQKFNKHVL